MKSDAFTLSVLTITLSLLLPIILYFYLSLRRSPPNPTPCPESYPLIGNLIGFLRNRHRFHDWVTDMLSATPTLTLQVNGFLNLYHGVATANPTNIHHLLRSNFPNFVKGSRFYSVLNDLLGDGIFNVDGTLWLSQRKVASHEFTTNSLKDFISITVQERLYTHLLPHLSTVCENDQVIDFQKLLQEFTFQNICSVAFGVELDSGNPNSSFVEAFDYAVEHCSGRFMSPLPAVWKIKRFLNIGSERKYKESIRVINDFAMGIIRCKEREFEERKSEEKEQSEDLLWRFMVSTSDFGFSDQEEKRKFLRDIVISFVLAGKDSTSTALTWFFWLITAHPECDQQIYSELSTAEGFMSPEVGLSFGYDDLKKFHYLHAALSESMRLFPPIPINTRLTVEDDIFPDGTRVFKGWFADYSAYAMGRMERLWGSDCREYKPERWLDGDGCFYQPSDQFKYPVFHGGPRTCLGKEMAYVQMKSIAAALMREFEVVVVDGGGTAERMMNPPYTLSFLLKMKGGLYVKLKRRLPANTNSNKNSGVLSVTLEKMKGN